MDCIGSAGHFIVAEKAIHPMPAALAGNGEGAFAQTTDHLPAAEKAIIEMSSPVQNLMLLAREYKHAMGQRIAIEQRTKNYLIGRHGCSPNLPEEERKKIWDEVTHIMRAVEKSHNTPGVKPARAGQRPFAEKARKIVPARKSSGPATRRKESRRDGPERNAEEALTSVPSRLPPWVDVTEILISAQSRAPYEAQEKLLLAGMEKIVTQLPVYPWWVSIRGLSSKSLALILAETGDLTPRGLDVNGNPLGYADKSKLWKRLGLAVIDGKAQGKRSDPEEAAKHGYRAPRRAVSWVFADSLFRAQWCGDRDADGKDPKKSKKPVAVPAHALGPYGESYARRRAATAAREDWTPKHKHYDAKRYMWKKLMSHLLAEWKSWS